MHCKLSKKKLFEDGLKRLIFFETRYSLAKVFFEALSLNNK